MMKTKGGQDLYVTTIVTVSTVTGTKKLLNQCQTVKKQDWGGRPLFNQSDLYVVPEALICKIFATILASTPSSSE